MGDRNDLFMNSGGEVKRGSPHSERTGEAVLATANGRPYIARFGNCRVPRAETLFAKASSSPGRPSQPRACRLSVSAATARRSSWEPGYLMRYSPEALARSLDQH